MRAATNTEYGTPDVLRVTETDRPQPGPGEVLVEVHAAAVTQGDRRLRAADFPGVSAVFGRLLFGLFRPRHSVGGTMFSGRVVAVGSDVTRFSVGDEVFGGVDRGAYAEYVVVSEDGAIADKPEVLDHAEAAAIPYGAGTALTFLRDMAKVQPGERVLVVGATGGVGRMAVQIARHLGAHVTAVGSRDAELVRALGADDFIDYTAEDFTARDERWDVIFDTTEGDHFRSFRGSLTETGRYLSLYMTPRLLVQMAFTALRGGRRAMTGVAMGSTEGMEDLRELVEIGAVRPVVAERFPLDRIADAHRALEGRLPGDVVIEMRPRSEERSAIRAVA
ncbi:MAG: NAD(P)-dependent alcohol dehydrogenase [Deltaproteobacteria bacterium]|nr:NAD(P)-dependent alcohol dehydrogenase [Deltaproteobacteria bacterium]